jgi:hypothetical protein
MPSPFWSDEVPGYLYNITTIAPGIKDVFFLETAVESPSIRMSVMAISKM